jgi:predicted ATPase/DNA-binding winged helix-turn-helix (wHTH) protein
LGVIEMSDRTRDGLFAFGPYRLYPAARNLMRDDDAVAIGSRAFDMLVALVQRPGEVLSRRELMSLAWPGLTVEDSNVRVQMAHLRREIHCGDGGIRYIVSIAGRGYCFVAPVEWREAGDGAAAAGAPIDLQGLSEGAGRVPTRPVRTVGREESLAELVQVIDERRLVTIVGAGGVGKTTLAVMALHALPHFERIHFVDLSKVPDGEMLWDAINSAIGTSGPDCLLEHVLACLSAHRTLLVLDNCEHVIDAAADVVDRLLKHTTVHLLATSREALRLPGETVHLLKSLAVPPQSDGLSAQHALEWPAVQLFVERAVDGGHAWPMDDEQVGTVTAICRELDGNPLAIELVASRTGAYGLERVSDLLDNQLVLSWRGNRYAPQRHQNVQSMLDWSYAGLGQVDQKVLRCLSIFPGAFSLDAALAVAGGDGIEDVDVASAIGNLVDKSLLLLLPGSGAATLRLSGFTKTYAAAKLTETAERERVHQRHVTYKSRALDRLSDVNDAGRDDRQTIAASAA